jgi:hypothetical protein
VALPASGSDFADEIVRQKAKVARNENGSLLAPGESGGVDSERVVSTFSEATVHLPGEGDRLGGSNIGAGGSDPHAGNCWRRASLARGGGECSGANKNDKQRNCKANKNRFSLLNFHNQPQKKSRFIPYSLRIFLLRKTFKWSLSCAAAVSSWGFFIHY